MSQEGLNLGADSLQCSSNIAQALMEEDLEREIARNQAANRMAKEREEQATAARKRAQESQRLMQDMMNKYELMRTKLEFTKKHLDDTNTKIGVQERLTEKIEKIKERVEKYTDKRETVDLLNSAVKIKADAVEDQQLSQSLQMEASQANSSSTSADSGDQLLPAIEQNSGLLNRLKEHVKENEERLKKREELKIWLEEQVSKGEVRAAEQSRIAKAKEDLLELKLRELKLQSGAQAAEPKVGAQKGAASQSRDGQPGLPQPNRQGAGGDGGAYPAQAGEGARARAANRPTGEVGACAQCEATNCCGQGENAPTGDETTTETRRK